MEKSTSSKKDNENDKKIEIGDEWERIGLHRQISSFFLNMLGFLLGLIAHGFFTGFFGGWDDNTIKEFKEGIGIARSTEIAFSPLQKAVELGHRFSPWKNKFKVSIFKEANDEAISLTREKVKMEI